MLVVIYAIKLRHHAPHFKRKLHLHETSSYCIEAPVEVLLKFHIESLICNTWKEFTVIVIPKRLKDLLGIFLVL
jgi:hypothetical protein